jgi:hypothetical protein
MKIRDISNDFADKFSFNGLPDVILYFGCVVVVVNRVDEVNTEQDVRFNELHTDIEFSELFQSFFGEVILAFV